MNIDKNEIIAVLSRFNPWWQDGKVHDIPKLNREVFNGLFEWVYKPPTNRAVLLTGIRQVGKTVLLHQIIEKLIKQGVPASNILYATFDHSLINLAGIDVILEAWREREHRALGEEYLFLDEAQHIKNLGTWVKHQMDFNKDRRFVFTGSAMPLSSNQESGVGRWHNVRLTTFSFYEYIQIQRLSYEQIHEKTLLEYRELLERPGIASFGKQYEAKKLSEFLAAQFPELRAINSLQDLFSWSKDDFAKVTEAATPYLTHFSEYLLRGGFPQLIKCENVDIAQRLLREDIIDKILQRDMTATFGVRRVSELERFFLYLCFHDGGLLDLKKIADELGVARPTVERFIELLEAANLIYRLRPFGYGKQVLRAKYKVYLADSAIVPSLLIKGKSFLEDTMGIGLAVEAAVFKHIAALSYRYGIRLSYWQSKKSNKEVDIIAEIDGRIVPFEVKYQTQPVCAKDVKGLIELCNEKSIDRAYAITRSLTDFGHLKDDKTNSTRIMKIPAVLFCYWIGAAELKENNFLIS